MRKDIDFEEFNEILKDDQASTRLRLEQEINLLSTYPDSTPDILDASLKTVTQDGRVGMIFYLKSKQNLIEEALKKIDNGSFGICFRCGKDIDLGRLKQKPYARYCIKCKVRVEKKRR